MTGGLLYLSVYIVQQLGVMLGVGAQSLLLCTHLINLHAGRRDNTRDAFARAARVAQGSALVLIIISGAGALFWQTAFGDSAQIMQPVFIFKWLLIALVTGGFVIEKLFTNWSDVDAWLIGGSWYALFVVHSTALVTTWASLLVLYVAWMATFAALWSGFVFVMRGLSRGGPAPVAQKISAKQSAPVAAKPVVPPPQPKPVHIVAPPPPVIKPVPPAAVSRPPEPAAPKPEAVKITPPLVPVVAKPKRPGVLARLHAFIANMLKPRVKPSVVAAAPAPAPAVSPLSSLPPAVKAMPLPTPQPPKPAAAPMSKPALSLAKFIELPEPPADMFIKPPAPAAAPVTPPPAPVVPAAQPAEQASPTVEWSAHYPALLVMPQSPEDIGKYVRAAVVKSA